MAQSGRLTTSDFMKMDKNDPRRQRWEETANKAHAQGMKELDKARYGSGSRQKAVQDPDSLEARVRDNSSTYGKTAEGKAYLHNKDQQAKSQAGADARTAARDYASQRREDTKSAYLEGQAAGRVEGRTAQAAEGRGRGGYGGPPRGYGGRGGDPRQMRGGRGGRGGFSSNPFRSGGMGRGGSRGMVDQAAAAGNAVASAEKYQNTGMKFNKEAQQWQHRDTGKAVSGKERADQVRHYGTYTEKGREGIGYSGKAPSNLEKGSDAYYGQEFSQSHARGSAWTEHQQKNDPTLDTKGLKSKWIEQRRAFDNYDPSSKATAAPATGGSMPEAVFPGSSDPKKPYMTGGNQSKGKDFLDSVKTQIPTREEELSKKYDSEIFNKEKGVVGQYFHDYAGTKPMEKGGDEAAYMKGMKDNWVERQMLGEKYDKEVFNTDPSKGEIVVGQHFHDYAGKTPMKKGGDEAAYMKGMKDAWIDKQQLGNQWDRDMITWEGDKAQHPSGMKAQSTKGAEYALGYINKHGTKPKDQSNEDYYKGMKDQWVGEQTGFAAGVKNKIAEVQGKGKGKDFLDSKIGKTPEKPKGTDVKDQIKVTGGNLVSAVVKPTPVSPPKAAPPQTPLYGHHPPEQTPPPKAAPPKGGMNTGATTDLSGGRPATQETGPGDSFRDDYQFTIPKHRKEHYDNVNWPANPPKATKPPITPPSDPYIPPSPTPPSYQEPDRDYIKYKNKKPGSVSSDADRYALLTGKPSMGGGTTTPKGGSSTPDYSYDYGLGKGTSDDADRYALLTGNYSGKSYLDKYLNR